MAGNLRRLSKQTPQLISTRVTAAANNTRLFCNTTTPNNKQEQSNQTKIKEENQNQKHQNTDADVINDMTPEVGGPRGPEPTSSTKKSSMGLVITTTETIRSFLKWSSTNPDLSTELQQTASDLSSQTHIHYKSLRAIWSQSKPAERPKLANLLYASGFLLVSPKPREKSEELKVRLRKLEELAERKAYDELVKDVVPKKPVEEPFSSYKDQLGFGLHVALTMFTGYLVGYAAFRALFGHNPIMSAAGGILGLVGGMLVETLLFIIKTSSLDKKHLPSPSRLKKDQ